MSSQTKANKTGDTLESFFITSGSNIRIGNMPIPNGSTIASALEEGL